MVMHIDITHLRGYFGKLGFDPKLADIYLALLQNGSQSISEVARTSGVERTYIHRMLNTLVDSRLVELEMHYKRSYLKAAPVENISVLLAEKEQELKKMQLDFIKIQDALSLQDTPGSSVNVQFYSGIEGYKQMFWHQTQARGETLCILHENMQSKTKEAYFSRWVRECNARQQFFRGIVDDHFIRTLDEWNGKHSNERLEHWQSRQVSEDVFKITNSTVVYDETVAYYDWNAGEAFGIEIRSRQIADSQRAFFEMLWERLG